MRIDGLNSYLATLPTEELKKVTVACNTDQEMCEIAHRMFATREKAVLLFTQTGTAYPVAMNLYASEERLLRAMHAENFEALQKRINAIVETLTTTKKDLRAKIKVLTSLYTIAKLLPHHITQRAPSQEVIERNPDLRSLPILKCWPHDGGRFITLPMVITQHPITGVRNVGMYRMQVIDEKTTAMHWHIHKTGARHFAAYKACKKRMPVAVALGGDPLLAYCATAPLPEGIDEFLFAGLLRQREVPMVKAITIPLEVPAEADFILEGYIDPDEAPFWEGPFGDHTGFYSLEDWYPRFHVTCITSRRNAIYPATIVGIPPMEDSIIAHVTEQIFAPLITKTLIPELKELYLPNEGVAHNLALIHGLHPFAGSGEKIANALWSTGQLMFTKYVLRLPDSCSLTDNDTILRLLTEVKIQDLFFSRGPQDILDHASEEVGYGSKLFIDTYYHHASNASIRWTDYGRMTLGGPSLWIGEKLLLQIIEDYAPFQKKDLQRILTQCTEAVGTTPRFVLLVNSNAPIEQPARLLWFVLANTSPARDLWIANDGDDFSVVIDARAKISGDYLRPWPNVVVSTQETIELVDNRWKEYALGCEKTESPSLLCRKMLINYDSATAIPWKDIAAQDSDSSL